MIRRRHEEEADDYGPGADLGISLFAVAILLLAIFGVGSTLGVLRSSVPAPAPAPSEPVAPKDAAARVAGLNDLLSNERHEAQERIVALLAQVEDLARRLQAAEGRPGEVEPTIALGEDERGRLELEIGSLREQLAEAIIGARDAVGDRDERAARLVILENENRQLRDLATRQRDALSQARADRDPTRRPAPLLIADIAEAETGSLFNDENGSNEKAVPTAALMRRLTERAALLAATTERSPANVLEFAAYSALDQGLDDAGADGGLALASRWLIGLEAALRRRGLAPGCLSFRPVGRVQALALAGVLSGNDVDDDLLAIDRALAQPETRARLGPMLGDLAAFDRRVTVHAVVRDDPRCEAGRAGAELRRLIR